MTGIFVAGIIKRNRCFLSATITHHQPPPSIYNTYRLSSFLFCSTFLHAEIPAFWLFSVYSLPPHLSADSYLENSGIS